MEKHVDYIKSPPPFEFEGDCTPYSIMPTINGVVITDDFDPRDYDWK